MLHWADNWFISLCYLFFWQLFSLQCYLSIKVQRKRTMMGKLLQIVVFPFVFCFSFYRNICSHLDAEKTRHTLSSNFKWMSFSQKWEIHSFKVALHEKITAVCLTLCCHLDIFLKCFDDILQIARCLWFRFHLSAGWHRIRPEVVVNWTCFTCNI